MSGVGQAPDLDAIAELAEAARRLIPEPLLSQTRDVAIRVQDFPEDEVWQDMGCESPFDLLGLYQGVALGEKEGVAVPVAPDMIFLYRRPILDYWCESGEDLAHVVRHVLIHEIGHHFGLSDADMHALEEEAAAAGG